jgi:hypothetical protein
LNPTRAPIDARLIERVREATTRFDISIQEDRLSLRTRAGDPFNNPRWAHLAARLGFALPFVLVYFHYLDRGGLTFALIAIVFLMGTGKAKALAFSSRIGATHRCVRRSIEIVRPAQVELSYRSKAAPARLWVDGVEVPVGAIRGVRAAVAEQSGLRGTYLVFDDHVLWVDTPARARDEEVLVELLSAFLDRTPADDTRPVPKSPGIPIKVPKWALPAALGAWVLCAYQCTVGASSLSDAQIPWLSVAWLVADYVFLDRVLAGAFRERLAENVRRGQVYAARKVARETEVKATPPPVSLPPSALAKAATWVLQILMLLTGIFILASLTRCGVR